MREPAAVDSHATTEEQRMYAGSVHQVGVIPVIDTRTDQNGAFALRVFGSRGPFASEANQHIATDAGVLLTPGRRVGCLGIVVVGGVLARQAAIDAVLRHQ